MKQSKEPSLLVKTVRCSVSENNCRRPMSCLSALGYTEGVALASFVLVVALVAPVDQFSPGAALVVLSDYRPTCEDFDNNRFSQGEKRSLCLYTKNKSN